MPFITADATGPRHLEAKISRAKFDDLTHALLERCRGPLEQALADAKLAAKDLDEVILVGGSTRIPAVQKMILSLTGKQPNQSVNPDEVVAIGAAIQAGVLTGELKDVVLLDVNPLSLGLETMGSVMTKIVERNTTIPARRNQIFSTAEDNQPEVEIHVLQGEREMAADNRTLGRFKLVGIKPSPRGIPQIDVTFDIDANGILTVSAKDNSTNHEQSITISGSSNLDKKEVERMVADSLAHEAQDKLRRQQVELKNEVDSLLYKAKRLLTEKESLLPAHIKGRLEAAVGATQKALDENADSEKLRQVKDEIEQSYNQAAAHQPEEPAAAATGKQPPKDDVIDAEFEEK